MQQIEGDFPGGVLGTCAGETAGRDASVVDQDVESSVAAIEVVESGLIIGGLRNVELDDIGVGAGGAQFGHGLFALLQIAGADDSVNALLPEFERGLKSDAAVAAGDECNFLCHTG